jgi:hypothetical protein
MSRTGNLLRPLAEWRKTIAQGLSRGNRGLKTASPGWGETTDPAIATSCALRRLWASNTDTPRLTPWAMVYRCSAVMLPGFSKAELDPLPKTRLKISFLVYAQTGNRHDDFSSFPELLFSGKLLAHFIPPFSLVRNRRISAARPKSARRIPSKTSATQFKIL